MHRTVTAKNGTTLRPKNRSALRIALGNACYGTARKLSWLLHAGRFARQQVPPLPFLQFAHHTPLLRKLKDVDMEYQYNKIINLRLAVKKLNGVVVRPGETLSYWRLVGKPTRRAGYVDGMILRGGKVCSGVGGGLCQLSNLIFWMTLHTPLTVTERHRHGYDVFPDANRTQPFGSGATCFYPHGDLMIQNNTEEAFQLIVWVGEENLYGEWRAMSPPTVEYRIVERAHRMQLEPWGGYSRHNELWRETIDDGQIICEELVVHNDAMMMYAPFLPEALIKEEQD
ncbi:MAG: vancomycin resistance protein VanW [Clostridiales bacterium]|jgi:vancomycin resistance protein VanW|nr:vancomycin resistance protein VanW [Clostridiales bacterium]